LVSPFEKLLPGYWKMLRKIAEPVSGTHAPEVASFNDLYRLVTGEPIIGDECG